MTANVWQLLDGPHGLGRHRRGARAVDLEGLPKGSIVIFAIEAQE